MPESAPVKGEEEESKTCSHDLMLITNRDAKVSVSVMNERLVF